MVGPVIQGADTLARTLAQASRQLADLTDPGRAAADALAVPARQRAPRLSGALAASIQTTATKTEATVGSPLVYAPVINYGWPGHNIRARRFLTADAADWQAPYLDHLTTTISTVKGI